MKLPPCRRGILITMTESIPWPLYRKNASQATNSGVMHEKSTLIAVSGRHLRMQTSKTMMSKFSHPSYFRTCTAVIRNLHRRLSNQVSLAIDRPGTYSSRGDTLVLPNLAGSDVCFHNLSKIFTGYRILRVPCLVCTTMDAAIVEISNINTRCSA